MRRPFLEIVIGHVTAVLAAAVFLVAGAAQLVGSAALSGYFESWGYPAWSMYVVGVLEILGAGLLLWPPTRVVGAILLGVVMLGAVGTHLMNFEYGALLAPIVCGGIAAISGYLALPRRRG